MDGISNYMDYFRISKQFAAMHFTTPECHSYMKKYLFQEVLIIIYRKNNSLQEKWIEK